MIISQFARTRPALLAPALAACFALAACDRPAAPPQPDPTPNAPATGVETGEQASIIRPDIEIARTQAVEPLRTTIDFPDGGAELGDAAVAVLQEVLASPQVAQFDGAIVLRGHSDAGGNDAVNMRVSQERAAAAADWLVENGVAQERIAIIAFGEQNPVAPNALPDGEPNEKGRAANRRVEVSVAVPRGATIPTPVEPTAPSATPTSAEPSAGDAGS